jgi:membrane protein implicated in regulation of membrane protease activity
MSRSFYILAATLLCIALLLGAVSFMPSSLPHGLPANASLWRMGSLFLLLACLAAALIGVLSHLFEQVDRRSEGSRRTDRIKQEGQKH